MYFFVIGYSVICMVIALFVYEQEERAAVFLRDSSLKIYIYCIVLALKQRSRQNKSETRIECLIRCVLIYYSYAR